MFQKIYQKLNQKTIWNKIVSWIHFWINILKSSTKYKLLNFFRFDTQTSAFKIPGHMETLELKTWSWVYHSHGEGALRTPAVGAGDRLRGSPPPHPSWHLPLLPPCDRKENPVSSRPSCLFPPTAPSLGLAGPSARALSPSTAFRAVSLVLTSAPVSCKQIPFSNVLLAKTSLGQIDHVS